MTSFGLTINEFYGQTECNLVIGSGEGFAPVHAGWAGKAIPGHTVHIVDEQGSVLPFGSVGNIAVLRPDPVMFLGYWRNEAATQGKFRGDWLITGDLGVQDELGYFRVIGREDDVITTAGYRVGPGEIESCLQGHPAVAMVAVVGVPDAIRTEVIKAVIVLQAGFVPSADLSREIQEFVRTRLAAHEYPRIVEFVTELPMTSTGKIIRHALRG
jgi:acetyl-CoA synthetase